MRAAASVTVNKQIAQVFTDFADLDKRSKFIPTITELKILSDQKAGHGVKWHEKRFEENIQKNATFTVAEYSPPRILILDVHSMGITYRVRYNFQPEGDAATKIIASIGGQQKGILARMMKSFLSDNTAYVHEQLQKELDAFKAMIEKS